MKDEGYGRGAQGGISRVVRDDLRLVGLILRTLGMTIGAEEWGLYVGSPRLSQMALRAAVTPDIMKAISF